MVSMQQSAVDGIWSCDHGFFGSAMTSASVVCLGVSTCILWRGYLQNDLVKEMVDKRQQIGDMMGTTTHHFSNQALETGPL